MVHIGVVDEGMLRRLSRAIRDLLDSSRTSLCLTPPNGPEMRPLTPAAASLVRRCPMLAKLELNSRMRGREIQAILRAVGSSLSTLIIRAQCPQLIETDTGRLLSGLTALKSLTVCCNAVCCSHGKAASSWNSYKSAMQPFMPPATFPLTAWWSTEVIPGLLESACNLPLRELNLHLSDHDRGCDRLTRSLAVLLSSVAPTLRRFSYTGDSPGSVAKVVADSLAAIDFLTLAIDDTNDVLPDEQYEAVADALLELGRRRSLTELELVGTVDKLGLLARSIESHKRLVSLKNTMRNCKRSTLLEYTPYVGRYCQSIDRSEVAEFGAALGGLSRLMELELVNLNLIHPPPPEIASAVAVPTLTSLTLVYLCDMWDNAVPLNMAPLSALTGLKELCLNHVSGNSPELMAGLAAMAQLAKLDISDNTLSNTAFHALAGSLRTSCGSLTELRMADVGIDFKAADVLAAALRSTPARLRVLDIDRAGDMATTAVLAHTAKTFHPGCEVIAAAEMLSAMGYV